MNEEEAVNLLWKAIFNAVRANTEDPVAAWEAHKNHLKASINFLNQHHFLQY